MLHESTLEPRHQNETDCSPDLADLLVDYLQQLDVEFIFGIPGGAIEPLFNALSRSEKRGEMRAIVSRHETGAAFMAAAFAQNSGKLGVCCSTTGPGATNLLTGVASAYESQIPLLVLTAQTSLSGFGRGALQDSSNTGIDTVAMFRHCTHYSALVSHPNQLEKHLAAAIINAFQAPRGPVHLSLPSDILRNPAAVQAPSFDLRSLLEQRPAADVKAVNHVVKALKTARKTVFVVGGEHGEAVNKVLRLSSALKALVVTTPKGKTGAETYHPYYRGVIGFCGHESAAETLSDPDVDLVVVVGTALSEAVCVDWTPWARGRFRVIHIDDSPTNFTFSPNASLHVHGDIDDILNVLMSRLELSARPADAAKPGEHKGAHAQRRHYQLQEEIKCRDDSSPIKPQRLMAELGRLFPPDTRYVADSGNSMVWSIHYLNPGDGTKRSEQTQSEGTLYRNGLDFASMGWGIGAAIGTALAHPGSPVVCITGDGSYLMSGQEITVAVHEHLPIVFMVLNDSVLGMVKHGQRLSGAEAIGFDMPAVDICGMAQAMGIEALTINSPQDLLALDIERLCAKPGPTLLDIRIDAEEVPPMTSRLKMLGSIQ